MYTQEPDTRPETPTTETTALPGLSTLPFGLQQKIEACKTLYLAYQGRHHEEIERQMRELGHKTFNRRVLYARGQRGRRTAGWPERYGWNALLADAVSERRSQQGKESGSGKSGAAPRQAAR